MTVRGRQRDRSQRGSGTILLMTVIVFMLFLASGFSVVGEYIVTVHRARAAADLAALAGAEAFGSGQDGCEQARKYAIRNAHRLAGCSVVGDPTDFVLTARIAAPVPVRLPGLPDHLKVVSHAGPVRSPQ